MEQKEKEVQNLINNAKNGDSASLAAIFENFNQPIYRFFFFRVSSRETAEDLTQTVFVEMIRSLHRYNYNEGVKFSAWLFKIARFRLIDHYRSHKDNISLADAENSGHDAMSTEPEKITFDNRLEDVWHGMNKLPEKHQTVLHLFFVEDMPAAEIAEVMGLSPLNVRVIKSRALSRLRRLLNNSQ